MNEGGLDQLWSSFWWKSNGPDCDQGVKAQQTTVTLLECQSAFYVLLLGK